MIVIYQFSLEMFPEIAEYTLHFVMVPIRFTFSFEFIYKQRTYGHLPKVISKKNGTLNTFLSKQTIISLIYSTKKYGKHNENNSKKMYVSILLKIKIKML